MSVAQRRTCGKYRGEGVGWGGVDSSGSQIVEIQSKGEQGVRCRCTVALGRFNFRYSL